MEKKCKNKAEFKNCELAILRKAVDIAERKQGVAVVQTKEIKDMVNIVEQFLRNNNLICYGGTAINNILPKHEQFYDKTFELPDYDFFSTDAVNSAKELADQYAKSGFTNIEAKSGQHFGTYKVFVNYVPIADITQMPEQIFKKLKVDSIKIYGILYAAPNYLRMSMYLELSSPNGDVSRWEKILKRLILLNKHYPLYASKCSEIEIQRKIEKTNENGDHIYNIVRLAFADQGIVFFGGYALSLYTKSMPKKEKGVVAQIPDFDALAEDPEMVCNIVKERLIDHKIKNIKIVKHSNVGEIIPEHCELIVGRNTIAFIYKPFACHSYNEIEHENTKIKIATIDTMLYYYLAFLYSNKAYYDSARILCMAAFLFKVQAKNRLQQKGVLKRFSIECTGHQKSTVEMRLEKSKKYNELSNKRNSPDYEKYFLNYKPTIKNNAKQDTKSESELESEFGTETTHNKKTIKRKKHKTQKKSSYNSKNKKTKRKGIVDKFKKIFYS